MDQRLSDAAWAGDVEGLQKLKDDPLLLDSLAKKIDGQTPLHIACMAGHLDFVKEMIEVRKSFAKELNNNGFSPLHIASANGDVEILKELLKAEDHEHNELCKIKGKEGRTPLHQAAIKGRVEVIRELLSHEPGSVAEVTDKGETPLHLAVRNCQFEALKVLVEHLKQSNKEDAPNKKGTVPNKKGTVPSMKDVLNKKDAEGNTILHLAVSTKQYEVVDFMLKGGNFAAGLVEVNSLNEKNHTPLDALLHFPSEAGDGEIEVLLLEAGAKRPVDQLQSSGTATVNQNRNPTAWNCSTILVLLGALIWYLAVEKKFPILDLVKYFL